jgi:GST-like protein
MIELYGGGSPNAAKISLMLEEIGRPYTMHAVRVMRGDQFTPEFLKLNPLGKYPVIIDHEGAGPDQPIFESGVILTYLAETYAPELLPAAGPGRWETLKWLTVQTAWVGPMMGQHAHFRSQATEQDGYAATRYRTLATRIYQTLNDRLKDNAWLAGARYSIADIATYPWVNALPFYGFDFADYPELQAWRDRVAARPATVRAAEAQAKLAASVTDGAPRGEDDINRFYGRTASPATHSSAPRPATPAPEPATTTSDERA